VEESIDINAVNNGIAWTSPGLRFRETVTRRGNYLDGIKIYRRSTQWSH
jgi:hypothetical protein